MPYQANIPQAADQLSQSQPAILGNFQAIATLLNFTAGSESHTFVRDAAPPATGATDISLYGALSATTGETSLFLRKQNNGATQELLFNSNKVVNGWSYLGSGIILQWGNGTAPGGNANYQQVLPIAFPNAILCVIASPRAVPAGNNTDIIMAAAIEDVQHIRIYRKTNFGTACNFSFLAIGH